MKRKLVSALMAIGLALVSVPALAMDHGSMGSSGGMKMDSGSMGGMKMDSGMKMESAERHGKEIRETTVEGYKLEYNLLTMDEMMKTMDMGKMDMSKMKSHHLMVFVAKPDGSAVTEAKAGFLVFGPGKEEQKAMAMGMLGGFGADVDFSRPASYKITAKIVAGDKTLVDEFTYDKK